MKKDICASANWGRGGSKPTHYGMCVPTATTCKKIKDCIQAIQSLIFCEFLRSTFVLFTPVAILDVVCNKITRKGGLIVGIDHGQAVGGVGGAIGIGDDVIGGVFVNGIFDIRTVVAQQNIVAAVACVDKFAEQLRALDRAKLDLVVKGQDHLQVAVVHLALVKVVRGACRKESSAQYDVILLAPTLLPVGKVEVGNLLEYLL